MGLTPVFGFWCLRACWILSGVGLFVVCLMGVLVTCISDC